MSPGFVDRIVAIETAPCNPEFAHPAREHEWLELEVFEYSVPIFEPRTPVDCCLPLRWMRRNLVVDDDVFDNAIGKTLRGGQIPITAEPASLFHHHLPSFRDLECPGCEGIERHRIGAVEAWGTQGIERYAVRRGMIFDEYDGNSP